MLGKPKKKSYEKERVDYADSYSKPTKKRSKKGKKAQPRMK